MELVKKSYQVFRKEDVLELGMPWVHREFVEVEPSENGNDAKMKVLWSFDCDYIDLRVRRNKESDKYLFEGRETTKDMIDYHFKWLAWKEKMEKLVKENKGAKVYIWSGQWSAYWRPNSNGYTTRISEVGVYDVEEAWKSVSHCGLEKRISFEFVKSAESFGECRF